MKKSHFAFPRALARTVLFVAALLVSAPAAHASMFATGGTEILLDDGYTLRYTYGWPSVLDAPENEGDLPTGVWGDVKGASTTYFFVQ